MEDFFSMHARNETHCYARKLAAELSSLSFLKRDSYQIGIKSLSNVARLDLTSEIGCTQDPTSTLIDPL